MTNLRSFQIAVADAHHSDHSSKKGGGERERENERGRYRGGIGWEGPGEQDRESHQGRLANGGWTDQPTNNSTTRD